MTDRPIIFSAPMVKALLDGRKAQTRRLLKPQPEQNEAGLWVFPPGWKDFKKWGFACQSDEDGLKSHFADDKPRRALPYAPGDRLWVREAHSLHVAFGQDRDDGMRWGPWPGLTSAISPDASQIAYYREGFDRCGPPRWRPSIHMPRWASRLTLIVTDVQVQRLQDISDDDAFDEGVIRENVPLATCRAAFRHLWNSLHGADAWDASPWVCAISFTVARGNIDEVAA